MASCFVYKVSRDLESIDHLCPQDSIDTQPFLVYCRELAPGTVSLTGDRAQGDDSKHDSHYSSSEVYTLVFNLVIVNKVLRQCHSWLARQEELVLFKHHICNH